MSELLKWRERLESAHKQMQEAMTELISNKNYSEAERLLHVADKRLSGFVKLADRQELGCNVSAAGPRSKRLSPPTSCSLKGDPVPFRLTELITSFLCRCDHELNKKDDQRKIEAALWQPPSRSDSAQDGLSRGAKYQKHSHALGALIQIKVTVGCPHKRVAPWPGERDLGSASKPLIPVVVSAPPAGHVLGMSFLSQGVVANFA